SGFAQQFPKSPKRAAHSCTQTRSAPGEVGRSSIPARKSEEVSMSAGQPITHLAAWARPARSFAPRVRGNVRGCPELSGPGESSQLERLIETERHIQARAAMQQSF